jgi:hypothetical protein
MKTLVELTEREISRGDKKVEANLMEQEQKEQGKNWEYAFQKAPRCGHVKAHTPTLQGSRRTRVQCLPLPWCPRWSTQGQRQWCLEAWVLQQGSKGRTPPREVVSKERLKPSEAAL